MSIRCKLTLHDWSCDIRTDGPLYAPVSGTRQCKRCGRKEVLDYHCLGLRPPAYVEFWNLYEEDKDGYISEN